VGFGYASAGGIGNPPAPVAWPSLPQGRNPVEAFIPVARIADMLLQPGADYDYNGTRQRYPHARLIYWAGGNAFHHHQDLNKLVRAWQRPETIIVHDSWWNAQARHADIVLPATTFLERNDIACSNRDRFIAASHRLFAPPGATRSDYEIFRGLARRLGCEDSFAEGRDEADWIRFLYDLARQRARDAGIALPAFGEFWQAGLVELPEVAQHEPLLAAFRQDPDRNRLATPSGRIEIASQRIAGFGYPDCPGHPAWREPTEWLGAREAAAHPLHLLSNQPARKLHSQWDHGAPSREGKRRGREPIRLNPADATARGLGDGDLVRVFNDRGALLACVVVSDAIRPGVAQMATGAWYDPAEPGRPGALDLHGNPNVLTPDKGTSRLAQGPSPNSCLVQVEAFMGDAAPPRCFEPPVILAAPPAQRRYTRIRKAEGSSHA
jgi:biotin/methionine sulfoxide reductase